jgi:activating signal cointegrator complex subunit 1
MSNVRIEKVAICRMGAVKGEDGEEAYGVEGSVDMP